MKLVDVALGVVLGAGAFGLGYLTGYVDARTQPRPRPTLLQRQAGAPIPMNEWYPGTPD